MRRLFALGSLAVAVWVLGGAPASAQSRRVLPDPVTQLASAGVADLHGVVVDDHGAPVAGAVVSALGGTTVFAVSDREGRFSFRNLQPGPYLLRAHLQGYIPAHGRITQVNANARNTSRLSLARRDRGDERPAVLEAGVGPSTGAAGGAPREETTHDHGEIAWRLRHLPRSVLRDAEPAFGDFGDDDDLLGDSLAGVGRVMSSSARLATALFAETPLSGQFNLLTTASFDDPEELFAGDRLFPRGVAHVAVSAPTVGGEWRMQGGLTQGDLSSWTLEGSFHRTGSTPHLYEAGMSYGMQRHLAGNAEALAAVPDGDRSAGAMYAYDAWTVNPRLTLGYGAKYSRYDYLAERGLFSPRATVSLQPSRNDNLRIRALVARREHAPGAEEFLPPSSGVWLPPERTFSPLSAERGFRPERVDHVEIAGEREFAGDVLVGLRAFRQDVGDQLVTMFGVVPPGRAPSSLGHYSVASGGDFEARGWGVSVGRRVTEGVEVSVDYSRIDTRWTAESPDAGMLAAVAASALRLASEQVHDVTASLRSEMPATATRVFVLYKMNSAFASSDRRSPDPGSGARFVVQVHQGLPFMNLGGARWEMLIAVRNMFREDPLDSSVYDELLVVRPPKRVVGGITVRF